MAVSEREGEINDFINCRRLKTFHQTLIQHKLASIPTLIPKHLYLLCHEQLFLVKRIKKTRKFHRYLSCSLRFRQRHLEELHHLLWDTSTANIMSKKLRYVLLL